MKTRIDIADVATTALLVFGIASAMISIKIASADELLAGDYYQEGIELGERNGGLLAQRVYKKLIVKKGCEALNQYQETLSLVASNVVAPESPDGGERLFTAGFFQGYLSAMDNAIKSARTGCNELAYDDGGFPGELAATVLCQAADQDASALASIGFVPIYDGWAANQLVKEQCVASFQATVSGCAYTGLALEFLSKVQNAVCY